MLRSFAGSHSNYDAWLDQIQVPHQRRIRVRTMDLEHNPKGDLTSMFLDGDVTIDVTRTPTRVATIALLDPSRSISWEPDAASSLGKHYQRMIRVNYDVAVPSLDDWISCPAFTGPVVDFDRDGARVVIVANGKDHLAMGNIGSARTYARKRKVTDVIVSLLRGAGEADSMMEIPDLPHTLPERLTLSRTDVWWKEARKLANAINRDLFYDGRGKLVLRKRKQKPEIRFDEQWLASEVRIDRDPGERHNRWIVLGPKPRGDKKRVSVDLRLPKTHPYSAQSRSRNGEPLWLIDQSENSHIKNHAKAKEIAQKRRDASLRSQVSYSFDTLPLPNVEEYDLVRAVDPAVGAAQVRALQVTIPLGPDSKAQSWGYLKRVTYHKRPGSKGHNPKESAA